MSKSVTPSLVYGGPWFANTGFDNDANEFVITEPVDFMPTMSAVGFL